MSPAEELARYLATEGVTGAFGGDADWSVHVSREPDAPVNVVTLYDTGGPAPLSVDPELGQPSIQVRVRSDDYPAAFEKHRQIRELFLLPDAARDGTPIERTIGGGRYVTIDPTTDILAIGRDEHDRHLVVANYQLIRQELEGT